MTTIFLSDNELSSFWQLHVLHYLVHFLPWTHCVNSYRLRKEVWQIWSYTAGKILLKFIANTILCIVNHMSAETTRFCYFQGSRYVFRWSFSKMDGFKLHRTLRFVWMVVVFRFTENTIVGKLILEKLGLFLRYSKLSSPSLQRSEQFGTSRAPSGSITLMHIMKPKCFCIKYSFYLKSNCLFL